MTKTAFEDLFIPYEVIDNLQYGAWGEAKGGNTLGRASPFGFTGRWGGFSDGRTELVKNWNRDLDPRTGRWVSKDPIGISGGFNLYSYVLNNSALYSDPWGLVSPTPVPFIQVVPKELKDHSGPGWGPEFQRGLQDLKRNYDDMIKANTKNSDKYFHCKAHCQAAKEGAGGMAASKIVGEGRELHDQYLKGLDHLDKKGFWKWDSKADCDADRAANDWGRNAPPNEDCRDHCEKFRPNGLSDEY